MEDRGPMRPRLAQGERVIVPPSSFRSVSDPAGSDSPTPSHSTMILPPASLSCVSPRGGCGSAVHRHQYRCARPWWPRSRQTRMRHSGDCLWPADGRCHPRQRPSCLRATMHAACTRIPGMGLRGRRRCLARRSRRPRRHPIPSVLLFCPVAFSTR